MRRQRRQLLLGSLAAITGLGVAAAWRYWPDQGLVNPCHAALPQRLAQHELVRSAWEGVAPEQVWDCHAHLAGTGDSASGIRINPGMHSLLQPLQYAQRLFYLNAGCAHNTPGRIDESYVERMHNLLDGMPRGCKLMLLAFDRYHAADGAASWENTAFYVPDAYAMRIAQRHPAYFEWVASIHPYRNDAVAALHAAKNAGARAVKWLPAAMGIDPASPHCDAFYAAMHALDLPLITHAGMERALDVADRQHFSNPLLLRRALEHGVRVIVAHCATMGQDRDLDRGKNGPFVDSFGLFARLMDDERYGKTLYGDLSAVTQINRAGPALARIMRQQSWHSRLLNGSDYPLPGIMPLYSLNQLAQMRFIQPGMAPVLTEIRQHNPLLFDFVLKRHLRSDGQTLPAGIFETRRFFTRETT
ncbi:MAG: amidohydrolase [Pseudomonadota bacterium]